METVPDSFPSLFAGYAVIWLIFGFFIASLLRRMRKLEKRLQRRSEDACEHGQR